MIPPEVWACAVGEGIRAIGGKVCRGVGVPGVQARFLCVWGAPERRMRAPEGEGVDKE